MKKEYLNPAADIVPVNLFRRMLDSSFEDATSEDVGEGQDIGEPNVGW